MILMREAMDCLMEGRLSQQFYCHENFVDFPRHIVVQTNTLKIM